MACCLKAPSHYRTWTNVDWSSVKSSDINCLAISQEMPQPSVNKICLKITCLKFHSNFPGVNELTLWGGNKMADNWQKPFSNSCPWKWECFILIKISLKCVPAGTIDKKSALDQRESNMWGFDCPRHNGHHCGYHDDVTKRKHFLRYWPFVRGIHWSLVNSPHKRPVTRSFDIFFDLRLNKRLSKQSLGWWFEMPSCSLWSHYNVQCCCDVYVVAKLYKPSTGGLTYDTFWVCIFTASHT